MTLLRSLAFFLLLSTVTCAADRPNIVLVFIDDMGWGDFSCFGNTEAETPNIDRMAEQGIRFHQFYVNSPICSPSRVAISTGRYPYRYRISSFLNNRKNNRERGMAQWLDPSAPMLARSLQAVGYATAHCGKWHMGGQRDVDNAPPITDYGFDISLTNFEGMGAKLLPLTEVPTADGGIKKGRIWDKAVNLGDPVEWRLRSEITGGFADKAIEFIEEAAKRDQPFYVNVWPDDVHGPYFPTIENWSGTPHGLYLAVLREMDAQLDRLFRRIADDPKLRDETLVLICSDNGPDKNGGSAGPFSGSKATLFEGGIRSPLIAWGPGLIAKDQVGTVNNSSVFAAMDLVPSLMTIAGVAHPKDAKFDGEDLSDTILAKSKQTRSQPIFFRRPPDRKDFQVYKNLPDLAVRAGQWKLMCDFDGKRVRLHDLNTDPSESNNVAEQNPDVTARLLTATLQWNAEMPKDAGDPAYQNAATLN
ncbi:MAG: sulfatase-like hydrolase/transferase [Rubripirellula sp.]